MIGDRRVLAVITARGGSKGLVGKNLMRVQGRPMLAWTISAGQQARRVDRVVLSSDDDEIMAAARALGCDVPFTRPGSLATDTAGSIDVVLHAVDALPGFDVVVLLQPTSPLRVAADIDAAIDRLEERGAPACVAVSVVEQSPYWMYRLEEDGTLSAILETPPGVSRRQDLPAVYALNGAVYVADIAWLRRHRTFVTCDTVAYVMPSERSLDIDTAADFEIFSRAITQESSA